MKNIKKELKSNLEAHELKIDIIQKKQEEMGENIDVVQKKILKKDRQS